MRAALAGLLVLAGCAAAPTPAPVPSTYPVPPQTVRPDERVPSAPTTSDGDTAFTLLGVTTGLDSVFGSHAEWPAKGAFVRIRISVVNTGRGSILLDARRQVLVDDQGGTHQVDEQAMTIRRQPDEIDLGSNVRMEFDVYYDLPRDRTPVTLRVWGGPTLTDLKDDQSTDIPLR
ncbi:DUF4352 domain-containing protein [Saccharothrix violaceirubra]|uniref:DUF4352 domain-containing protein n=1 Tax=Saccharothrix violaceirubra TaxID=413306 RepID=A0A7W7T0F0_9PSEU|nr:DUF4352 domain-containing protein [Saccharothrix violaceirubra]MBB4964298.1 hypothetical protein [Saccharothrix violaceirubra]